MKIRVKGATEYRPSTKVKLAIATSQLKPTTKRYNPDLCSKIAKNPPAITLKVKRTVGIAKLIETAVEQAPPKNPCDE